MKARLAVATAALIAATLPYPVRAQDDEDGPGRGVARISLINGDVSVRRGDTGEFVAAAINSPVVVLDRVVTGVNSRAEVQLDYANYMRLSGEAEIRLSQLENRRYQIQVARGMVTYNVLRDSDAEVEIATPAISLRPLKRGIYRIEVRPDDTTMVTVRSGELEVFTPQGSERLKSGRTMMARGSQDNPEVQVVSAERRDTWDEWNEYRNRDLERAHENTYRYVNRDVYGAEDLYGHGDWIYNAPYGYVWSPRVSAGWAPYRYGRWTWVDWYGWSWVSYDSWGWAPYHYGRWFYSGNRWCWWPGGLGGRHYWRPALVAWVGWGGGGVGIGFGRVGWIPLAPYERFHPWYGNRYYGGFRNRTYIDNSVNIVNNVNIYNTYRNSRVNNGITGVNGSEFGRGRQRYESFNSRDLNQASLVRGQVPYAPDRDSVRFTDRETRITRAGNDNQRFYSRGTPASVDRVSFDDQRRGMEQVSRRTFGESGERVARGGESGGGVSRGSESSGGSRQADSFTRGGESGGRSAVATDSGRGSGDSSGSGWRRFGEPSGRTADTARGSESRGGRESGQAASQGSVVRGQESRGSEGVQSRTGSNSSGQSDGWRRLGSSGGRSSDTGGSRQSEFGTRGSADRGVESRGAEGSNRSSGTDVGGRSSSSDSNGWRRFGDPGSAGSQRSVDRAPSYGDRGTSGSRGSSVDRGSTSDRSSSVDRGSYSGRSQSSDRSAGRSYESPRISPPVVRERNNESYGGRSSGRTEERSQPRYTPRSSGGDYGGRSSSPSFGGGGRSSGGGSSPSFGGGGRSSGGGSSPSFGGGRSSGGGSSPSMGGGGGGRSSGGGGRGGRNQ
ncbi:MAG: FecR domain-containing protein [Bryobacterales bacterium]|nr:FecR domain-containing protein [Bryobacterales bacterium]